jgi:hypothetical protein
VGLLGSLVVPEADIAVTQFGYFDASGVRTVGALCPIDSVKHDGYPFDYRSFGNNQTTKIELSCGGPEEWVFS